MQEAIVRWEEASTTLNEQQLQVDELSELREKLRVTQMELAEMNQLQSESEERVEQVLELEDIAETGHQELLSNLRDLKEQLAEARAGQYVNADLLSEMDGLKAELQHRDDQIAQLSSAKENEELRRLQKERDEAVSEMKRLQLEKGIAESASREVGQKAMQLKERALLQQRQMKTKLAERESEIERLRDRMAKMKKGMSSIFVKTPKL